MVLLQQMGILFVYMMIGYVACKKEYFDQEFGKKLSWLVVNVANPMLAISAVVNNEEQIAKKEFYVTGDCCSIWKWSTDLCSSVFCHVQYSLLYMGNSDALWGW